MTQEETIAHRLMANRQSLKDAFGAEYAALIAPPVKVLTEIMRRRDCDPIHAFMHAVEVGSLVGLSVMIYGSAYLEIIESDLRSAGNRA